MPSITLYDGPAREVSCLEAGFSIVLVATLRTSGAVTMDPTTGHVRRFRVSLVNSRGNRLVGSILGGQTPRNEQLISVPVCIGFPSAVAPRIARETYETAALPLSYVGRSTNIADAFTAPHWTSSCCIAQRAAAARVETSIFV